MKDREEYLDKKYNTSDQIAYTTIDSKGKKSIPITSNVTSTSSFDSKSPRAVASRSEGGRSGYNYGNGVGSSSALGMTYVNLTGTEMVRECLSTYRNVGIVKNIIDLMADFATEGVDIIHQSPANMKFWKVWMEKIDLEETINKMIVTILSSGTLCTERRTKKISMSEEKDMKNTTASKNFNEGKRDRVVPYTYKILNPLNLNPKGIDEDGDVILRYSPNGKGDSSLKTISNDPNYFIAYYKRQDWEFWGTPIHYAALGDIAFENKMMRMDESAMDGVINMIRLWKIGGQLKDGTPIFPDVGATSKLASILQNDTQGGVLDIIWDQFLDLKVEYPDVGKILGSDKYTHPRQKILEDFGIAEVLIDGSGGGSYSNQYLSVASLIEKLKYLRNIIKTWLTKEVRFVAKNMGMKQMPEIKFKNIDLSDKNAERSIALQCVDRGIMSKEQFLEYFNENWEIEKQRLTKEKAEEDNNEALVLRGPFLQESDEVDPASGKVGGDGRPANQPQEKTQKKKRKTKPAGASEEFVYLIQDAKRIFNEIADYVDPEFFKLNDVKHVKHLSKASKQELEDVKYTLLCNSVEGQVVDRKLLEKIEDLGAEKLNFGVKKVYDRLFADFKDREKKEPTKEDKDNMRQFSWVISKFEK